MPQHGLTDEELKSLTEEERKAILDGEEPPAEEGEGAGKDAEEGDVVEAEKKEGEPAAEAAPEPGEPEPFAVGYNYDPASFNEPKAREDLAALDKLFQEGEIDLEVYNKNRDNIRDLLQTHRIKAELSVEMNRQVAWAKWSAITAGFMEVPKNSEFYANPRRMAALDAEVRLLAQDTKNSNKSETWIIREADRLVREAFVGTVPEVKKAETVGEATDKRRAPAPPQTLADIPSAAPNDEEGGEFAHLESLQDGTPEGQRAFEKAVAKLTPDQQARWAS